MTKRDVVLYFSLNTIVLLSGALLWLAGNRSVAGSLIAAGIVGYVIFWATYINLKRSAGDATLLAKMRQCGVSDINDRRLLYSEYAAARENTREHLDIMGFGLRNFMEDNAKHLGAWSRLFEMRILVVNPDSPYCSERDYEEGDPDGKIRADVLYATQVVRELNNPRVQLRWYEALPITNILRMDNLMWVGPYFIGERSRNAYALTLERGGALFKQYLSHFEGIWSDPKLSCEPRPILRA